MVYTKKHPPELGDIVLCSVTRITNYVVFVTLLEHNAIEGMIHISEVAPGRIRNLRDYVKEGKTIVCKVLKLHDKGHVDLSLRRVGVSARVQKLLEYKQEEKAEKLLEQLSKQMHKSVQEVSTLFAMKAYEQYHGLYPFFEQLITHGTSLLHELGVSPKDAQTIMQFIHDKIPKAEVIVKETILLTNYAPDGVIHIKHILEKVQSHGDHITLHYLGAPKYHLTLKAHDYKEAEKELETIHEEITTYCAKNTLCTVSFEKDEH